MFQGLIIAIHVIACAGLIFFILIQQGKGGGLIDTLSSAESIFGSKTNTFLAKMTTGFAITFFITCLLLAFVSTKQSQSVINKQAIKSNQSKSVVPLKETTTNQVPTATPTTTQAKEIPAQNTANTQPQTETKQTNSPQTTDAAKEPAATK